MSQTTKTNRPTWKKVGTFRVCEQWGWVTVTVQERTNARGNRVRTHQYLSANGLLVIKRVS
jgi:hypothetical protein